MTVSKPKMVCKTPSYLSKYIAGGTRSRTTKIAFHYTGAHDVKGINTINNWFNSINRGEQGNRYASSHFVMDLDGTIYTYIPMKRIAWTTNAANYYSIGIECATTGDDDHYTDKEYVSMVKLGAWLAQYYGLDPREDFIRHYDVTKKICPRYFVNHFDKWKQFKLDCYNYLHGKLKEKDIRNCTNGKGNSKVTTEPKVVDRSGEKDVPNYKVKVITDTLNVRYGASTSYDKKSTLKKGDVVTITHEKDGWGLIQGAKGWISLNNKYVKKVKEDKPKEETKIKFQIQTLDKLNIRKVADWDAKAITTVKKGQILDVVDTVAAKNGSTPMYRLESGLYITASEKYVKIIK